MTDAARASIHADRSEYVHEGDAGPGSAARWLRRQHTASPRMKLSGQAARTVTVAIWIQGDWAIENALHWIRDVVFDEDRHQLRTGSGPQVMTPCATPRSACSDSPDTRIAAALRHHGRDPRRPTDLILAM